MVKKTVGKRFNVLTTENDGVAKGFEEFVPRRYADTNRFLTIVQWNIEWFGASKSREKDQRRISLVTNILAAFGADLYVLQEIVGPSRDGKRPGALDHIAEALTKMDAGDYVAAYTDAGGEQRVAMLWDRDWIRAKSEVTDLFPGGKYQMKDGKDPFAGRTPLYGFFASRIEDTSAAPKHRADKFDFQALGVHLKAMEEGHAARLESAKILADWMKNKAPRSDNDILVMGDWNAPPDDSCWKPLHDLERKPKSRVKFRAINDPSDYSYLWLRNRSDKFLSKIDLTAMSLASETKPPKTVAQVVKWKPIEDALAKASAWSDKQVLAAIKEVKETLSDHLPTVTQFFIAE